MALKELDANPELRDDPSLKDFNDLPSLAKSYKETKAHVGNSLRPPGPDATPEAKKDFYEKLQKHAPHLVPLDDKDESAQAVVWEKLGRPKDAKEYDFKVPEGVDLDLNPMREMAKEAGLTKAQFQKLADRAATARAKALETSKADKAALKAEWGQKYDQNLATAAAAARKLKVPEEAAAAIEKGELSSSQLKTWLDIATAVGAEGSPLSKQGSAAAPLMTPAEAEAQIQEIMAHPDYFNANGPKHEYLVKRAVELQKFISKD